MDESRAGAIAAQAEGGAEPLRFRLSPARAAEVDDGLVRMAPDTARSLGLRPLDAVRIATNRASTVARVDLTEPGELAAGELRLGGLGRHACGGAIGQWVTMEPVSPASCRRLHLRPSDVAESGDALEAAILRDLQGRVLQAGMSFRLHRRGRLLTLRVTATEPEGVVSLSADTALVLQEPTSGDAASAAPPDVMLYEDLGGLEREIARLREIAELPLRHPGLLERMGVPLVRGLVLAGPRGVGRRALVRALAFESGAQLTRLDMAAAAGLPEAEALEVLEASLAAAASAAPALVLLEDAAALAGAHGGRLAMALAEALDALPPGAGVLAVATVARADELPAFLRRSGRFDREVTLPAPDAPGRQQILDILTRGLPLAGSVDLARIAAVSHGYVGADLAAVAREALFAAVRRSFTAGELSALETPELAGRICIGQQDFEAALNEVPPSATFAFFSEVPQQGFAAVGGLTVAKELLAELVVWPLRHAALYDRMRVQPQTGLLLCGPSGCGKTMLVRALAREANIALLQVNGPQLQHGWFGEPEQALAELFQRAKAAAPCIVLLDELDVLLDHQEGRRADPLKQRLLVRMEHELDQVAEARHVWVLATCRDATDVPNRLYLPGRLDRRLDIPMPEEAERLEIVRVHTASLALGEDVSLEALADATGQFSGADIAALCRAAAQASIRGHLADRLRPAAAEAAQPVPMQPARPARIEGGAWVRRRLEAVAAPQPEAPPQPPPSHAPDGTPLVMLRHFERAMDQMRGNG